MTASNTAGSSAVSNTVTAMTLEAAPSLPPSSSVSATVQSSTSITVQWGVVPCIDQNGVITGYSVQYGVVGSVKTPQTVTAMGNVATISDITPSANYTVEVAAVTQLVLENTVYPSLLSLQVSLTYKHSVYEFLTFLVFSFIKSDSSCQHPKLHINQMGGG